MSTKMTFLPLSHTDRDFVVTCIGDRISNDLLTKLTEGVPDEKGMICLPLSEYDLDELIGNLSSCNESDEDTSRTACFIAKYLESYEEGLHV